MYDEIRSASDPELLRGLIYHCKCRSSTIFRIIHDQRSHVPVLPNVFQVPSCVPGTLEILFAHKERRTRYKVSPEGTEPMTTKLVTYRCIDSK